MADQVTSIPLGDVRMAHCPMPDCRWTSVSAPEPSEHPGALAEIFGWGVFAATARSRRLEDHERQIRDHIRSHPAGEWAIALAAARAHIAELEGDGSG